MRSLLAGCFITEHTPGGTGACRNLAGAFVYLVRRADHERRRAMTGRSAVLANQLDAKVEEAVILLRSLGEAGRGRGTGGGGALAALRRRARARVSPDRGAGGGGAGHADQRHAGRDERSARAGVRRLW